VLVDQPHGARRQLRIDLLRRDDILLDSNRSGIKPGMLQPAISLTRDNRTLATEWAYSQVFTTNTERANLLPTWLEHYNLERPHLGIGGQRPIDRVNNATSQNN